MKSSQEDEEEDDDDEGMFLNDMTENLNRTKQIDGSGINLLTVDVYPAASFIGKINNT